jgi:hypothetical protein
MTRNSVYPADYMEVVCEFNRRFILHLLIEKIESEIYEECGLTLKEYVRKNR